MEFLLLLLGLVLASPAMAETHHHNFVIQETPYTRLCRTKSILTVNGEFPGPNIYARRGDTVVVRAHNRGSCNVTLHWHGVKQPRNPWYDGPEYITQCPIQPGANFTYRVQLTEEEGTLWWHAHSDWTRATVHGAIVVRPKVGSAFPFPEPDGEILIILGEWWNSDVNLVIAEALRTGSGSNISDAHTINGQPGHLFPCSKQETFTSVVEYGKTYLLRVVNAAINNELFFAVAGHPLTVVGKDASYVKPFSTDYIMITPGQTFDLLLHANISSGGRYFMAAVSYFTATGDVFDNTTATGILQYRNTPSIASEPHRPIFPAYNDTTADDNFASRLHSLDPINVSQSVDRRIVIAISVNELPCINKPCQGPDGNRAAGSLNNISFASPSVSVLQAYYQKIDGVFTADFPIRPPFYYNFTSNGLPSSLLLPTVGTKAAVLEYGTSVEVVLQGANLLAGENHPMHLHGYSFYVVGRGSGNYDEERDPATYNLVDPPYENTVGVPKNGWAAVRFRARNPGVWFMHCHLDRHLSWGMDTVFIVKNGPASNVDGKLRPPPADMPPC